MWYYLYQIAPQVAGAVEYTHTKINSLPWWYANHSRSGISSTHSLEAKRRIMINERVEGTSNNSSVLTILLLIWGFIMSYTFQAWYCTFSHAFLSVSQYVTLASSIFFVISVVHFECFSLEDQYQWYTAPPLQGRKHQRRIFLHAASFVHIFMTCNPMLVSTSPVSHHRDLTCCMTL